MPGIVSAFSPKGPRSGLVLALLVLCASPLAPRAIGEDRMGFGGSIREVPMAAGPGPSGPHRAAVVRTGLTQPELSSTIDFELAFKLRDLAGLRARTARHELISRDEMASRYHPLAGGYKAVLAWLASQGFTVTGQDGTHVAIFASGTVSQVSKAFNTTFARVAYENGEFTSAITAPSVPAALAPAILAINGLQPHLRMHLHSLTSTDPPYTPAQILSAYTASGLSVTGAGQTIGIVIDTYPSSSDLISFWSQCGISQSLSSITHVAVVNGTPSTNSEDIQEATLDVEWSSSIAPGAKVNIYETRNLSFVHIDQAYQEIYNELPGEPGLRQISLSYGAGEVTEISADQLATDQAFFLMLASGGVTVFASSGDGGSSPGSNGALDNSGPLQVESPASDASVTGVGGTTLALASNGTESTETAWDYSGGGSSIFSSRPSWQTGQGVASGTFRLVPDVASAADQDAPAFLVFNGTNTAVGGTSWSSPTWAGICALINQARANGSQSSLGLLGPQIYPLLGTSAFRDITSGNNGAYNAGAGYDEVTGLGVPNVASLIAALSDAPTLTSEPASQAIMAGTNFTASVTAVGNPSPTFQWQVSTDGGSTWTNLADGGTYSGTLASTLTVTNPNLTTSGYEYRCVVTNSVASTTSSTVTLIIDPASTDTPAMPLWATVVLACMFVATAGFFLKNGPPTRAPR